MPWKECHVMDERLRFVARLLEGEKMAPLCAEFGISRKTGYKIFDRVQRQRRHGVHRSQPTAVSPGESSARGDRGDHRASETGVPGVGRAQDPREIAAARHAAATARRSAPSTRCWIVMGSCTGGAGDGPRRRARRSHGRPSRMRSGVRITRASSCSAIGGTAIR